MDEDPQVDSALRWTLHGHSEALNCLVFSDDGKFLASGADDGHIRIWSLRDGSQVQRLSPKQGPVTVLRWYYDAQEPSAHYIISGGADGTLQLWKSSSQRDFFFAGIFTVTDTGIEDIVVDDTSRLVAVAFAGRISVLKLDTRHKVPFQQLVVEPPSILPPRKALARRIHFSNSGKSLFALFLDSKDIISWNVSPWQEKWRAKLVTRIGNTAWSPETKLLLVWNLLDGVDVYHVVEQPVWIRKLRVKVKKNNVKQVEFGWSGKYAMSGSDTGEVYIWDVQLGSLVATLRHGAEYDTIQTLSYHSPQAGRHYIATANSEGRPTIKVWALPDPAQRAASHAQKPLVKKRQKWRMLLSLKTLLLSLGVALLAVAGYFVSQRKTDIPRGTKV